MLVDNVVVSRWSFPFTFVTTQSLYLEFLHELSCLTFRFLEPVLRKQMPKGY
jgi:hypothetical protein